MFQSTIKYTNIPRPKIYPNLDFGLQPSGNPGLLSLTNVSNEMKKNLLFSFNFRFFVAYDFLVFAIVLI
jgi:hypothetical protein